MKIFYRKEQSSDKANSYSPSAGKPALAVADWLNTPDIAKRITIETFEPVSRDVLYAVHDRDYVDGVLDGKIENGFGNYSKDVAATLPYTVGSMVAAAKQVLTEKDRRFNWAVSPTSGFHHAGHDFGSGFCTFNGLMAAAVEAHRLGLAKRVLILDFDAHYGNGTEDIIRKLGIDFVTNVTATKSYKTANQLLRAAIETMMVEEYGYYDLVLYQAGADAWVDDPLGSGLLTFKQLGDRDVNVFTACAMRGSALVINLAGGYSKDEQGTIEPVLKIHRQTIRNALEMKH